MTTKAQETCSCGAAHVARSRRTKHVRKMLADWREQHRHEAPEAAEDADESDEEGEVVPEVHRPVTRPATGDIYPVGFVADDLPSDHRRGW